MIGLAPLASVLYTVKALICFRDFSNITQHGEKKRFYNVEDLRSQRFVIHYNKWSFQIISIQIPLQYLLIVSMIYYQAPVCKNVTDAFFLPIVNQSNGGIELVQILSL